MSDNSTVKITIDIVDANSGKVISTVTENLSSMGTSGAAAGKKVAFGMKEAGEASAAAGTKVREALVSANEAADTTVTKLNSVEVAAKKSAASIASVTQAAMKSGTAGSGEMQQMMLNIEAAQKKFTNNGSQGTRKPGSALGESFAGLGTAAAEAQALGASFARAGEAGVSAGSKIGSGMQEAGAHTLSNLDKVRLLRDDLGIRIPRAMENVIARSSTASAAIGAIGSGLIALGAIEIFARMAMGVYELYKRFIDTNGIIKEFNQKLSESADKKFMDVASIEDVNAKLRETNAQMDSLQKKRQDSIGIGGLLLRGLQGGLLGAAPSIGTAYGNEYFNTKDAGDYNKGTETSDAGRSRVLDSNHDQIKSEIALQRELAGALHGTAKARRDADIDRQEHSENRRYDTARTSLQVDIINRGLKPNEIRAKVDPNAGAAQQQREDLASQAKLAVENAQQAEKNRDETLRAQAEARNAGLRGEADFRAKVDESERILKQQRNRSLLSETDFLQQRSALEQKYAKERVARIAAENSETARLQAEAAQGGLTGVARVDAATTTRLAGIDKEAPGFSDPATAAARRAAAQKQGLAEQARDVQEFNARLAQYDSGRSGSATSATQRIELETKRTIVEIEKAWREEYGQLAELDQRRVQGRAATDAAIAQIQLSAARERQQVRQGLEDETQKAEAEGARRGLTREQEQNRAIVDEYNERIHKLEELRTTDAANADLYRRQELAAEAVKNGKLIEQQRELRDKLAGVIRGFISNPLDALKRQGEEAASKFGADLLLKATHGGIGSGHGGDGIFGGLGKLGRKGGPAAGGSAATVSAGSTTLSAGSAVIYISGSASFVGGGSGSGGGSAGAAALGGGGFGGGGFSAAGAGALASLPGASASGIPGAAGGWSSTNGSSIAAAQGGISRGLGAANDIQSLGQTLFKDYKSPAVTSALGKSGALLGKAGGFAGAGAGLFGAYESNGGLGGALGGALSGAKLGAMLGGPLGAAIGAAGGAILGAIGFGGGSKAQKYDSEQVKPRIAADALAFGSGSMDYQSAYDDLNKLDVEARQQTKQWGPGGERTYNGSIKGEIRAAMDQLTREQKAGRSRYGMAGAQFHTGGLINGFGDFSTRPGEGFIHAQVGETVMHQQATQTHGDALALMLAGADRKQMAGYYGGTTSPAASSSDVNMHFHSHDARGTYQLFMDHAHTIRAALNSSYEQNTSGADNV